MISKKEKAPTVRSNIHSLGSDMTDVLQDLEIALNYGQATGAAPLLRFVTEHTEVGNTKHKILFAHPEQNRLFTAHPTPTGNAL
jgi:hypothetical protein